MKTKNNLGDRVIVIGGSIAGMLSARILSDYFTQVTIIDRELYLAIPKIAKDEVFSLALTQQLIVELKVKLLVYSLSGEIISWEQKN